MQLSPASTNCPALARSSSVKESSCGRAVDRNAGMPCAKPAARLLTSSVPVWSTSGTRPYTSCGMPASTLPIMGSRLPCKKVRAVSASACMGAVRSAPVLQSPSTFCAAAFMAAKLPVRVVAASFAVVPVMSRSVCIIWMALYISARLPSS